MIQLDYDGEGAVFRGEALSVLGTLKAFEEASDGFRCYMHMSEWAGEGQTTAKAGVESGLEPFGSVLHPILDLVCLSRQVQTRPPEQVQVRLPFARPFAPLCRGRWIVSVFLDSDANEVSPSHSPCPFILNHWHCVSSDPVGCRRESAAGSHAEGIRPIVCQQAHVCDGGHQSGCMPVLPRPLPRSIKHSAFCRHQGVKAGAGHAAKRKGKVSFGL